ncbi:MAG: hypothetical protein SOU84_03345 [Candidatus Faecimonas sp.]|nr:hypothetical protein [Mycoplasmatota bacterium]MDY2908177.1 hypothetical protein [Candidatus Faecimonas sp.]
MNQFPFPYIPNFGIPPMPPQKNDSNFYQELEKLKQEINTLKKRISKLEYTTQNDYLKKEDGMYML